MSLLFAASTATPNSGDLHSVVDALVVASLLAILGIGIKMLRGQRRTHEALWGFTEGGTKRKGLVEIVQGNGHGSILDVCEAALSVAKANGAALDDHVVQDNVRWDSIDSALSDLGASQVGLHHGQESAAQTAEAVSVELHGSNSTPIGAPSATPQD